MVGAGELLGRLQRASETHDGASDITFAQRAVLGQLTDDLAARRPDAGTEYQRFIDTQRRGLPVLPDAVNERLHGATVLVTGGTGCIGSALLTQLLPCRPARLVSVSRGVTVAARAFSAVEYHQADVRDDLAVRKLMQRVKPDFVFHLAAVRDPGEAQSRPDDAITTNVLGTRVVLEGALAAGVPHFAYASTGKAVRYYTQDVYAATKKIGEAIVGGASARMGVGAARFTHVVYNSLIHANLKRWMREGLIRLHAPEVAFYVQSAAESAQLLLMCTNAQPGRPLMYSIRDLGPYFDLVDLALGMRQRAASNAAIIFTGFPPGYASLPHAGQYDPRTLDECGPLINTIEAAIGRAVHEGTLNEWPLLAAVWPAIEPSVNHIGELTKRPWSRAQFLRVLDEAARALLDSTFVHSGIEIIERVRALSAHHPSLSDEHLAIDSALAASGSRTAESHPA